MLDNSNVPIPGVTVRALLTNVLHSNVAAVPAAARCRPTADRASSPFRRRPSAS